MKEITSKYIEVDIIEEIDETCDVYDITVEDNHNFFANNMLVHNCLGGIYSNRILRGVAHGQSRAEIQSELTKLSDRFLDCVGDNFNLELQFNKIDKQHVVNDYLIEHHKLTNIPIIATADSHYPTQDKWQARELYKKLGWLGKRDGMTLPQYEELQCELFPKNASQMWDEFKDGYSNHDFYKGNEELVKGAIERTHDIVWNECEDTWVDSKAKLPKINVPGKTPFKHLSDLVKEALIREGLADNKEYVDRAKEELSDIKFLGHESYFITMYEIFKKAETKTLFGPARGSGGGSLVNYLLGITQLDPIPYNLLWSRFLGRHRVSWPDIDTDAGDRDELINAARELYGDDAVIPVSNFNTLKLKSLIKDISKFHGVPFDEVNKLTGPLQEEVMALARDENQEKSVFVLKHEDCMKYSPAYQEFMEKYPEVGEHVATLFMQNRSCFTKDTHILTNSGYMSIEELDPSSDGIVYIDNEGKQKVNHDYELHYMGKKEVFEIESVCGKKLKLTADHEVMTQEGYKKVCELSQNDVLIKF